MKLMNVLKRYKSVAVAAPVALYAGISSAVDITGVESAIAKVGTDGGTVGGWIIAAVAAVIGVGIILAIMKKI